MRHHGRFAAIFVSSAVAIAVRSYAAPVILNPGFEDAGEPNGYGAIPNWTQNPNPSGFAGYTYLSGTNGFAYDNGVTPDPSHVAFIQVYGSGSNSAPSLALQQQLSGFALGDVYTLSYAENARGGTNVPLLQVKIDGTTIVAQHVDNPVGGSAAFRTVTSDPFTVTTSTPLLQFIASQQASGDDATAVFDNIQVRLVPEPASLSLVALAASALLRRRR